MRPARLRLLTLLALLPGGLAAQEVTVRSGEHGSFTRLVFDIPPGAEWQLEQAGQRVSLGFGDRGLRLEAGQVFARIDRSRLADLLPREGGADLMLACACVAEAFVLRERMLVVDIRPGAVPAEPAAVEPGPAPPATPLLAEQASLAADLARVRVAGLPGIGPEPAEDPLLPRMPSGAVKPKRQKPAGEMADPMEIGAQLAEDLAMAATEGILDAATTPRPERQAPPAPAAALAEAEDTAAPDLAGQLAQGLSGLDRERMAGHRVKVGGTQCLPDSRLRIGDWGDPEAEINALLANRRSAVFGEFDRIDDEAVLQYAKALLHYGFGAEARATLDLHGDGGPELLRAMARLIDLHPRGAAPFEGQTQCPGLAALWSLLALPDDPGAHMVETAAVLRGFELLPVHLRDHLGPTLAARLSATGHPAAARDLLNRLERSTGEETDSIALGRAQIDLKQGDLAAAEAPLRDLAIEGGPQSPDAVLASIRLARAAGQPLPGYLVDLTEAYALEFRNDPRAPEFRAAHITALFLNGDFEGGFAALDALEPAEIPEERRQDLRQQGLRRLTKGAEDVPFMKHAMAALERGQHPASAAEALAMAHRFLDLGLPDVAIRQLAPLSPEGAMAGEVALLRARALIDLGRPEEAEILLIARQGEAVDRLRAEARRRMGDHQLAGDLYAQLGEAEAARRAAFLSGDWQRVSEGGDDALTEAASLAQAELPEAGPIEPSLAGAESLSAASVETRETIRALLEATALSPD